MTASVEDQEELWNSWSSVSEAAIILDGRKLNDVFTSIRNQLEFLRRQNQNLSDQINGTYYHQEVATTNIASALPTIGTAQDLRTSSASPSQSFYRGPIPSALLQSVAAPVLDAEELKIILDRIHALETDVRKHDSFGERIDRLEANMNAKFITLQAQMEKLTARVDANSAMSSLYEKMFTDLEGKFEEKLHTLGGSFDEKLGMVQQSTDTGFRENENTVHALRDLVQVNELRLKKAEKDVIHNGNHIRELQETVDYFPVKYLDNIRNDILELYMVKASKDDLGHKFDIAQAEKKADQDEVVRLEQHTLELTRRLDLLTKELHDGFGTIDSKLEKRIDKVAHWCLKHLRKELRERGGDDEPRDGTDIGRVKCLVCDQVVVQQRETEIVHGGPPMKNVIKPHHLQPGQTTGHLNQSRPRSASPPPNRGRGFGTGPSPLVPGTTAKITTAPGTLPSVNTGKQQTTTTHSKLVKLGAQPIVGASNPAGGAVVIDPTTSAAASHNNNNAGFTDDVEPAEDFNYRLENDAGTPKKTEAQRRSPVPAPESPLRLAQPATMHARDPAGTLAVSASQPALQQQVHQFHVQPDGASFRDLEERFVGGRRQSNGGTAKQLNYKYDTQPRPQTAPMKRAGMAGSKLKGSSVRPMPFEDA